MDAEDLPLFRLHEIMGEPAINRAGRLNPACSQAKFECDLTIHKRVVCDDGSNDGCIAVESSIRNAIHQADGGTFCVSPQSLEVVIGDNVISLNDAYATGYIIESILQPDKAIAEHYENRMFLLEDGTIQKGIVTFRSESEVVVRDAALAGKEVQIPAAQIVAEKPQPSAMPAGLADQLRSRQEFLDLAKFVSVLGKAGDYANDESPVIRKWRLVAMPGGNQLPGEHAEWIPAYSKVDGELPSEDFPAGERVFARGNLIVQVSGQARLSLNSPAGIRVWLDGKEILDPRYKIDLAEGRRTLIFEIDRARRGDVGLRVELVPIAESPARFQPEGGT